MSKEVYIDGVKYVPESEIGVTIQGVTYDNVGHWLMNIHSRLVNKWIESTKSDQESTGVGFESVQTRDYMNQVKAFELFCENFLGFEMCRETYEFKEKQQ